jgi:hypothetical protein
MLPPMHLDFVRLAQETSSAVAFEQAVLDELQRRVGFDIALLSVKGAEAAPTAVELSPKLVERAIRGAARYDRDLLPVKQAALQARGVAVDTAVLGEAGMRRTAYYRDIARHVGGRHSLLAYVPLRGRVIAGILLGRTGSAFSNGDLTFMQSALPELGVARASYGLPVPIDPLRAAPTKGLLQRLKAPHRSLAVEPLGGGTLEIRDRDGFREMVAREHGIELVWTRAGLRDPCQSGWPYVELLHLAAVQAQARTRALFIGCGGAVALRQFARVYPGIALDLVEREARVVELAREFYDLDRIPGLSVSVAEGAEFLARAPASRWDIIVVDAFEAAEAVDGSQTTAALLQPASFRAAARVLRTGGALAVNLIGTLDGYGPVARVTRQLTRHFARVRVVPVMEANEAYAPITARNVVLVASRRAP